MTFANPFVVAKYADGFVRGLEILIVLGIGYSLVDATIYFFSDASRAEMLPFVEVRTDKKPIVLEDIVAANLFGRADTTVTNVSDTDAQAPESHLELTLQGVFRANDPQRSTAIVAEKNKPGQLYGIGDTIYANTTLTRVADDRIVLRQ